MEPFLIVVIAMLLLWIVVLNVENSRLASLVRGFASVAHDLSALVNKFAAHPDGDDDDDDDDDTDTYEHRVVDVMRGTGANGTFTDSDLWTAAERIGDGSFASRIREVLRENAEMRRELGRAGTLEPAHAPADSATARS